MGVCVCFLSYSFSISWLQRESWLYYLTSVINDERAGRYSNAEAFIGLYILTRSSIDLFLRFCQVYYKMIIFLLYEKVTEMKNLLDKNPQFFSSFNKSNCIYILFEVIKLTFCHNVVCLFV